MNATEDLLSGTTFVLPSDATLVSGSDLPSSVRGRINLQAGEHLASRPGLSSPTTVLDEAGASLILEFREPRKLVDAVIRYADRTGGNPEQVLEESIGLVRHLVRAGFLTQHASPQSVPINSLLSIGHKVGDFELLRCIKVSDIAEVYQVAAPTKFALLKIGRPGASAPKLNMLANELRFLEHLDGSAAPNLIAHGKFEGRPYFATQWIYGTPVSHVAQVLRARKTDEARTELAELCHRCVLSYAPLHERGVVHGDIHTGNLLIDNEAHTWLIDFGLARFVDESDIAPHRGGVAAFLEPEYACAALRAEPIPSATFKSEQYGVAALIYLLLTGNHYLVFSLEREEMFRQIADDMPFRLADQGCTWWPEVEQVLLRALAKKPADRHLTAVAFAEALRDAADRRKLRLRPLASRSAARNTHTFLTTDACSPSRNTWVSNLVDTFRLGNGSAPQAILQAPMCSLSHGAAGIAYGLWQLSCRWQEPSLLSLANIWATQAATQRGRDDAFCTKDDGLTQAVVGEISPFHTESGVHCVRAFIARSMGDRTAQRTAVSAFLAASKGSCSRLDLTLGWSGSLLACSLLMEAADDDETTLTPLKLHGDAVLSKIWAELCDCVPLSEGPSIQHLGIAHGWSGMAYAAMRWSRSTKSRVPNAVEERLWQLADLAEPVGRGCRWPWLIGHTSKIEQRAYMPGWCNGTAGFVHVWALAYEVFREPTYLRLAEQAAWNTFVEPGTNINLCCGLAGRAYALLSLYKLTQGPEWLNRAKILADRGRASDQDGRTLDAYSASALERRPHSLYKGDLGLALLLEDLASPEDSSMPFFESQGWSPA